MEAMGCRSDLIVAGAIFIASVAVAIGLSLFVLTVVLRMQHRHRKRLARVGRRRMSGRLDMDEARLMLVRQKQESNLVVKLTEALAQLHPAARHRRGSRANFRRAALELVGGDLRRHLARGRRGLRRARRCSLRGRPIYVCLLPGALRRACSWSTAS